MHRLLHSRAPLTALGLLLITILAVLLAAASLSSPMTLDTPLLHYWAWLVNEQQLAPYRDAFETSMPMTLLVHMGIGSILGYDDVHIRIADILILAVFCGLSFRWLRRIDTTAAWAASALFALVYLAHGTGMSLQRDYLAIIPIVAALGALPATDAPVRRSTWLLVGVLFALAALIKPHALLALIPLLWTYWQRPLQESDAGSTGSWVDLMWLLLGLAMPVLLCAAWLASLGGLTAFIEMTLGYLPLHNQLNGNSEAIEGLQHVEYLWGNFIHLGGYARWLGAALFGIFYFLTCCTSTPRQKREVMLVLGLIMVFAVYPAVAGKFWRYHYLPLLYFLIVGASLLLAQSRRSADKAGGNKLAARLPSLCFFLTILVSVKHLYLLPAQAVNTLAQTATEQTVADGRVAALENWLQQNLQAGDTLQVLDWGGGALHALLRARQPIATRFLYDYHFYHSQSEPLIHKLRAEFIEQLRAASPSYIIENRMNQGVRPHGRDTTPTFAALQQLLSENYFVLTTVRGYRIYQRAQPARGQ
jgi:hypothetical protein